MTPGPRGWIVVATYTFVLVAFGMTGHAMGKRQEAQHSHVAFETKGDKHK